MRTEDLPSRWDGVAERLPDRLEDLRGPTNGTLSLPLHLAWSGMRDFDLNVYRQRLSAYHVVVTELRRKEDAVRYLNAGHLLELWPNLRRLLGPRYRQVWETRFPGLATNVPSLSHR
ncbi:MAG TPA: hypothetical protein VHJ83_06360 [Micromonosporaceae bacterium]|nr:hypothetical protein [Micromonosporaceae bacterium]